MHLAPEATGFVQVHSQETCIGTVFRFLQRRKQLSEISVRFPASPRVSQHLCIYLKLDRGNTLTFRALPPKRLRMCNFYRTKLFFCLQTLGALSFYVSITVSWVFNINVWHSKSPVTEGDIKKGRKFPTIVERTREIYHSEN